METAIVLVSQGLKGRNEIIIIRGLNSVPGIAVAINGNCCYDYSRQLAPKGYSLNLALFNFVHL